MVQSANNLGLAGQAVTQRKVEGSIRYNPVQLLSQVLRLLLANVPAGQMGMQVRLKAKREGRYGHVVLMQVRVVGSARNPDGQNCRHCEEVVLTEK